MVLSDLEADLASVSNLETDVPEELAVLIRRAASARKQGKQKEALGLIDEALTRWPSSPALHTNRAILLFTRHRLDEALRAVDSAISLSPTYPQARAHRAAILSKLGDQKGAEDEFRLALNLDPTNAQTHHLRAISLYLSGDLNTALQAVNQALLHLPNDRLLTRLHERYLKEALLSLVDRGDAEWNGERATFPGTRLRFEGVESVSDLVIAGRR
jgi:Flp pilus assembly protein TadD